jgi:aspartate-semialdehyde dehydrogenase
LISRQPRIAVVGATGTVGSQIADLISERALPFTELKLFGRETGRAVEAGERTLPVVAFNGPDDLSEVDIAFLAIPRSLAVDIVNARPKPLLIDLSAATAAPVAAVPLAAPGITPRDRMAELADANLVGLPHPAAQVIAAITHTLGNTGFAAAAVMLSASAGGHQAISDLFQQSADLLNARLDLPDDQPQLAFNAFPPRDSRELAQVIAAQVERLVGAPPQIIVDVLRVPTFHGSAVALFLPANGESGEWPMRLRSAPGIILVESDEAASFVDAVGQEAVIVRMTQNHNAVSLWCTFDAPRLAALTAVWVAETVIQSPGG